MLQITILVLIILIWVIFKIFEGISNSVDGFKNNQNLKKIRNEKFGNRKIDYSLSLFQRNLDIISKYTDSIKPSIKDYYYIDNLTRDCINDICIAENKYDIKPGYKYLSKWKDTIDKEWLQLAEEIQKHFKNEINVKENNLSKIRKSTDELEKKISEIIEPDNFKKIEMKNFNGTLFISQLKQILTPNIESWVEFEDKIINKKFIPQPFPEINTVFPLNEFQILKKKINGYNSSLSEIQKKYDELGSYFNEIKVGYKNRVREAVHQRINYLINKIELPESLPKIWENNYDSDGSILIVEIGLPDIVHTDVYKIVSLKTKNVAKQLTQKEKKEIVPKFHPAIILRIAYEIMRNDTANTIKLLVVNGWVEYNNPATGLLTRAYTSSLAVNHSQIDNLNLSLIEPLTAFQSLKGKSAGTLIDIIPISPLLSLDKNDKRIIQTKEVIDNLNVATNLAAMDWVDFENLIAELFQKEFSDKGAEVKLTQSSRDRGVDAIVFDPDPIKGGKFVIQAKRYTKTVDVSSVRDLCAVVKKEGASRGIMVTTSSYGSDAYSFAQNEPVTLLNGSELLGLLAKHGYNFRINIEEARKIIKEIETI
jgi:restriction system protein